MDHRALVRPTLPGKTPAPAPAGLTSVYGTRTPAKLERIPSPKPIIGLNISISNDLHETRSPPKSRGSNRSNSPPSKPMSRSTSLRNMKGPAENLRQRTLLEKTLSKMISKLPYEVRENVASVLTMAFNASEHIEQQLEASRAEVAALRAEVGRKVQENHTLSKSCEIFKQQIKSLEENVETLKDNIDMRQKNTIRGRSAMTKIATTNRMLIDALEALQTTKSASDIPLGSSKIHHALEAQKSIGGDDNLSHHKPTKLAPLAYRTKEQANENFKTIYEEKEQRMTMYQNDKLRESLMKVTREHYRSIKNAEILSEKVVELRAQLRAQEQTNRKLKSELDEMKAIHHIDSQFHEEPPKPLEGLKNFRAKSFGYIDDRFQDLLERNVVDPIDGINQLRRILAHMSTAPSTFNLLEMIAHICSRDVSRMFDVDMVCLYLVKPGHENIMHKFSCRSRHPQSFDITSTRSLAAETIQSGKIARVNLVSNNEFYNPEIDDVAGLVVKRVLYLPLIHNQNLAKLGVIQLINKGHGKDAFGEVDELFGVILANQASLLLTGCVMYDAIFYHSQLLQGLLEASTELYAVVPEPGSLSARKPLNPGEILVAIERITRNLLKCAMVRVFLVSDFLDFPAGQLVFIDPAHNSHHHLDHHHSAHSQQFSASKHVNTTVTSAPVRCGVVGHVVAQKTAYLIEQGNSDTLHNPMVDLDPVQSVLLTIPIMDLRGKVMGCIQLVAGARGPIVKQTDDPQDFRLHLMQATQWLTHQLAPPLEYLLSFIGKPVQHPATTPSKLSRSANDPVHRPSFISSSAEVVTQTLSKAADEGLPKEVLEFEGHHDFRKATHETFLTVDSHAGHDQLSNKSGRRSPTAGLRRDTSSPTLLSAASMRKSASNRASTPESGRRVTFQKRDCVECATMTDESLSGTETQSAAAEDALRTQLLALEAQLQQMRDEEVARQREEEAVRAQWRAEVESVREILQQREQRLHEVNEDLRCWKEVVAEEQREKEELREEVDRMKRAVETARLELERAAQEKAEEMQRLRESLANGDLTTMQLQECRDALAQLRAERDSLAEELAGVRAEVQDLQTRDSLRAGELTAAQERVEEVLRERDGHVRQCEELQRENEQLTEKLQDKEIVVSVLQEQVVRLAGKSMEVLDAAMHTTMQSTAITNNTVNNNAENNTNNNTSSTASDNSAQVKVLNITESDGSNKQILSARPPASAPPSNKPSARNSPRPPPNNNNNNNNNNNIADISDVVNNDNTNTNNDNIINNLSTSNIDAWTELMDEYGQKYFYNTSTGESSWDDPRLQAAATTSTSAVAGPGTVMKGDWLQHFDEYGREYWVNQITGQSEWEINEEVQRQDVASSNSLSNSSDQNPGLIPVPDDEDDLISSHHRSVDHQSIYDTTASHYSATAGDYTIEL